MAINKENVRSLLRQFEFRTLFIEELGWDNYETVHRIKIQDKYFTLEAVAEKRGVQIFVCQPDADGQIPAYPLRRKIDNELRKLAHEHVIIYINKNKTNQRWQWVSREPGKPSQNREEALDTNQSGEALVQKLDGIAITLNEEEALTITDVTKRLRDKFDREKVTKKFYASFKDELSGFIKFLKGIPDEEMQKWYASVMMNRLMFIYFIEKQGFLNGDQDYLKTKLQEFKRTGENKYYREFLCPLFFSGFALKEDDRQPETRKLLGKVPYLNGGLFLEHEIETLHGKNIIIPDSAFSKLFAFFDLYKWHLDDRPISAGDEINPEILGYIFEKYTNQKQMGAYYTKEDITEYISKNTIIPYLFDEAKRQCKIAFEPNVSVWKLLQDDPDRYIYDAVRRGVIDADGKIIPESKLPDFVQVGMKDPKARMFDKRYNLGDAQFFDDLGNSLSLPTETWREYVERRNRCLDLRNKLKGGEVHDINDLITYNLNIRQFAQDVIETCEGPELLKAFWKAICEVTILDPTCGSGAFLFAALNILEPLYYACLARMQVFVEELEASGKQHRPEKFCDFRNVLDKIEQHPNRRYFILKSIIVNNLYGVDIMDEATEICKLRFFLKLVAQLETPEKIEPLPDIDFNIRAGNTLVGYATAADVQKAMTDEGTQGQARLVYDDEKSTYSRLVEKLDDVKALVEQFRKQQIELGGEVTKGAKDTLKTKLKDVEQELNRYLATEYGIDLNKKAVYKRWMESHKPFHWFVEFYGIMRKGGFDVIIGNPPYVEYCKVEKEYSVKGFGTLYCGNVYAFTIERTIAILKNHSRWSFIIPMSAFCTQRMDLLKKLIIDCSMCWIPFFGNRPSTLFSGSQQNLCIPIGKVSKNGSIHYTSKHNRWAVEERSVVFQRISFEIIVESNELFHKFGFNIENRILRKVCKIKNVIPQQVKTSRYPVYYSNAGGYWLHSITKLIHPQISKDKCIYLANRDTQHIFCSMINSSLFFWYWESVGDCYHVTNKEILTIGVPQLPSDVNVLESKLKMLLSDYANKMSVIEKREKTGLTKQEEFYPKYSKSIIDEIDQVLAKHFGFTNEELDFIINYDIKYRMGRGAGNTEDE